MTYHHTCSKCGETVDCEVDLGEHLVDIPDCDNCGHLPKGNEELEIYSKALEDCTGSMIDRAHDMAKDRDLTGV